MTNETNQTKVLRAQYEDTNFLQEAHYIHKQNKTSCKKPMRKRDMKKIKKENEKWKRTVR